MPMFSLDFVKPHLERLLTSREWPKTIYPSEAARGSVVRRGQAEWRDKLGAILCPRFAAMHLTLRYQDQIEILQKGQVLPQSQTLENTTGPIRLRKKKKR
jgi:hypothetical protein